MVTITTWNRNLIHFKTMDYLAKGQQDYTEFCNMFDGQKWSDVDNIVRTNNLYYGAEKPSDGNGLADINYKNILATIRDEDGIARVNLQCEIYDNDGNFINVNEMD